MNALNIDHRMILGGEQPNLTNALAGGVTLGGQIADMQHQGAYRNALAEYGAGALGGEQTAVNALAGFDPQAMQNLQIGSLGMDQTRLSMDSTRQQMHRLDAQERRAAEEYARGLAADEAQSMRAQTEDMLKQAAYLYMTGQRDALPDFLETNGFARDAIAWDDIPREIYRQNEFTTILGDLFPAQPEYSLVTGDQAAAMGLDPAGAYNLGRDGKVSAVGGGGTNVTVNNGGEIDQGKLYETLDKAIGDQFAGQITTGVQAQRNLARVDALEQMLQGAPGGFMAQAQMLAGNFGIQTEGLAPLQAAQALINAMVPEQRQPGSGPMSDADLELFKQSLPRLVNTPEGNAYIIATLRGLNGYDMQMGDIAQRVANRQITPAQAATLQSQLENPLANLRQQLDVAGTAPPAAPSLQPATALQSAPQPEAEQGGYRPGRGGTGNTPSQRRNQTLAAPQGIDPSEWEYLTPEERALWQ
ncbi:flagellar rod assembly protein and murein hydrolase [Ketogulonicigenium robustum]|uniref:Flagellar rod assembly protein and murein hydrolase n=1 Tax=Ketogulonicigenium robustum TaxID=92947 RepID=A0A1W6NYU9_9RHOB|nr:hypothetical protein [Ketogulonicigenium robustum]ARO14436.1 flagellar rod assembly protein and murein hydrolase [Ketogulonicigenium robustum]